MNGFADWDDDSCFRTLSQPSPKRCLQSFVLAFMRDFHWIAFVTNELRNSINTVIHIPHINESQTQLLLLWLDIQYAGMQGIIWSPFWMQNKMKINLIFRFFSATSWVVSIWLLESDFPKTVKDIVHSVFDILKWYNEFVGMSFVGLLLQPTNPHSFMAQTNTRPYHRWHSPRCRLFTRIQ